MPASRARSTMPGMVPTASASLSAAPSNQLTPHFSLDEFTDSDDAARQGFDNTLPLELMPEARATAQMMEEIRAHLARLAGREVFITVTSGYRCLALNRFVKSSDTSDHRRMMAVDWRAPDFGTPLQICEALAPQCSVLGIGQLIHEFGSWIHTSRNVPRNPVNRIITIDRYGTRAGILPARR